MGILANYRLEIQPRPGQTAIDCVPEVCNCFSDFLVNYYKKNGLGLSPPLYDGRVVHPTDGHTLSSQRFLGSQHALGTVEWTLSEKANPHCMTRTLFTCAADRQRVELSYRADGNTLTLLNDPSKKEVKVLQGQVMPVMFMAALLGRWRATVEAWPVPVAVQFLLQPIDVKKLVECVIMHPKRTLPVVLLAADGRLKVPPKTLHLLQRPLLGAAHLAALMNPGVTKYLTSLLGKELACAEGLLRIYNPLFTRDSQPQHHPLLHAKDIDTKILDRVMHGQAMKGTLDRASEGPVIASARAAMYAECFMQRDRVGALTTRVTFFEEQLKHAETERDHLRQSAAPQRDRLRADYDETRQALRSVEGKLGEQMRVTAAQTLELQTARTNLAACEQELTRLQAERGEALDKLAEREQELAQSERDLTMLREQLLARDPSPRAAGELEKELNRAWQENNHCLAELEIARRELAALQAEAAVSKQNIALMAASSASSRHAAEPLATPHPRMALPASTVEALQMASDRHGDVLEIWEDAWKSAKASQYKGPTRVLESLQAIVEVGRSYFTALQEERPLGTLEQAFQAKIPFKYAHCESEMTMAMYGRERVFHDGAKRREIQRHLTLGGGGINCLQVYFDFDDAEHKVIIGYCGQHLSHFRQT